MRDNRFTLLNRTDSEALIGIDVPYKQ